MLPRTIPTTYGTAALVDEAKLSHQAPLWLLEPPVNDESDRPGAADGDAFRAEWDLDDECLTVVVVSRLISWFKAEGLVDAIDTVQAMNPQRQLQLVIVGTGGLFETLSKKAARVNAALGRRAVVLTGPMLDPRPAYAAADVVLGMGSSALRGMAFAKPVVLLGEAGFREIYEPATEDRFLREGFYGYGGRPGVNLASQLSRLYDDPAWRDELGRMSRRAVEAHFGLTAAGRGLERMYGESLTWDAGLRAGVEDAVRTGGRWGLFMLPDRAKTPARRLASAISRRGAAGSDSPKPSNEERAA
jgi:glycosyltransferase involved in cell wall biosynthesis